MTGCRSQRAGESFGLVKLKELLTIRKQQPAFHPNATQFTLQLRSELFGVWRQSQDRKQSIFAITNLCQRAGLDLSAINLIDTENWHDLITQQPIEDNEKYLKMSPYQTVWITNQAAPSERQLRHNQAQRNNLEQSFFSDIYRWQICTVAGAHEFPCESLHMGSAVTDAEQIR